jgi:type I site-specific restriction-modification system R (restriction) subunit
MEQKKCDFKVKAGAVIEDVTSFDAGKILTAANCTDELALYHIANNPNCKKYFTAIPEDIDERVAAYLSGENKLSDEEKAKAAEEAAQAEEELKALEEAQAAYKAQAEAEAKQAAEAKAQSEAEAAAKAETEKRGVGRPKKIL